MSDYDYCRTKVALPGSSLYYSLLYARDELRASLTALHAASEALREAAEESSDALVARSRLAWWDDEMRRALGGAPRHPITTLLAEPLRRAGVDADRMAAVVSAFDAHARRDVYESLEELVEHARRVADMSGCMAAELCGFDRAETLEASRHLGVGLALAETVRRPRRARGRRIHDLPGELLARCGADERAFSGTRTTAALACVLELVAREAGDHLRQALDSMPAEDRRRQGPRRALAEMALAQLGAIARAGFAVLERPYTATPLRKLWIAWKHRP